MRDNKFNFTVATINNLASPEKGKRSYYYDNKTNGLGIMLFPSGAKTFFLYKRVNNHPDKIKIGKFPETTIEQARRTAYSMLNDISQGLNPNKEKQKARSEPTFGEIFNKYISEYAQHHKISWTDDKSRYEKHLKQALATKKLSAISRSDIQILHNQVKDNVGYHTANRCLALLSTVWHKVIEWGYANGNPATGIKKFPEQSRDRSLRPHEMQLFLKSIGEEPELILRSYFYISLLTGARRNNILTMKWKELSLENSEPTWRIPKTKNGKSQVVALVPEAVLIIQSLPKYSEWIFHSSKSKTGHLVEPKSAWKRILKRAGIEDLRIHDLRRTLASWQVRTGANSFVIGKTLGHKTQQATAIYAQVSKDVTRDSMEKAVKCMFEWAAEGGK